MAAAIWCLDPQTMDPGFLDANLGLLTSEERGRADALKLERIRHEYLRTRLLQRLTLSRYADVDPKDWVFAALPGQRPEIAAPHHQTSLRFSLTHTAGLIACAVARDVAIGLDAERIGPATDIAGVASRFFAPEEAEALLRLEGSLRQHRVLELWTLKEACFKALGTGLSTGMDALRLDFKDDGSFEARFTAAIDGEPRDWQFERRAPTTDHILGLAIRKGQQPNFRTRLRWHPS